MSDISILCRIHLILMPLMLRGLSSIPHIGVHRDMPLSKFKHWIIVILHIRKVIKILSSIIYLIFTNISTFQLLFEMASNTKRVGRLLAIGLVAFFIAQVIISVNKLRDKKTAVSATTEYEEKRLMPSISVCFAMKKSEDTAGSELLEVVQKTLNDTRPGNLIKEIIISFDLCYLFWRFLVLKEFKHTHYPLYEGWDWETVRSNVRGSSQTMFQRW